MSEEVKAEAKTNVVVELAPEEVSTEVKAVEAPSREDLRAKGWSAKELDEAEKRGMVKKADEKKTETAPEKKEPVKTEAKAETKTSANAGRIDLNAMDKELTPEQEKAFLEMFGPGSKPRAFYFRAKSERQLRQKIEADNQRLRQELESRSPAKEKEVVEDAEDIDKPLTKKDLIELSQKEREAAEKQQQEMRQNAARLAEAHKAHEEYAREIYPDFEETVKLANDLAQRFDELLTDPRAQKKAKRLLHDLGATAARAHEIGLDDWTEADIAYELGSLHPDYKRNADGAKAETTDTNSDKANGGLTPEQMKRLETNTQRRASSASLPGSGSRRTVTPDEVTVKDFVRWSFDKRESFRKSHPEQYAKLLRG